MIIVGNWKANVESVEKAKRLFATSRRIASQKKHQIVLAPSAPHLGLLSVGNRSKVAFAAQDISATLGGAETGETTAAVVAGVGATYVIIGHSERRAQGETDALLLQKVQHTLAHGLTPILCVGERERDADAAYLQILRAQVSAIFGPLSQKERMQIVVAYEPVWAIGHHASEGITPADLHEMVLYIRKILSDFLPGKGSSKTLVLYGGAVEVSNARILSASSNIDGFLVGHISSEPTSFTGLAKALS